MRVSITTVIPVSRPDVGDEELTQIREALESGWIGLGPKVGEFEDAFANKFGYDHTVATNSCTHALDLSVKCLDLSGSEILVPPITWISTAFVAVYNGYDVGWIDVEPDTLSMSPDALADRISEDTAAVIPVHYGGQPAEIEEITAIAKEHDAAVIEDCAHAIGTESDGQPIGTVGDVGCFSFEAKKPLTTGEGGAIVTTDDDLAERLAHRSRFGVDKSTHERAGDDDYDWYYEVTDVGYKYFMHDISAGIGLAQLDRLSETRSRRNEIADTYADAFSDLSWIKPLREKSDSDHARYNYTVRVPASHRDDLIRHLSEHDVGATVHYMPLYKHPVLDDHSPEVPVSDAVWEQILTLPMSSAFSETDIATVVSAVESYGEDRNPSPPAPVDT